MEPGECSGRGAVADSRRCAGHGKTMTAGCATVSGSGERAAPQRVTIAAVIVDSAVYIDGHRSVSPIDLDAHAPALDGREFAWIGMHEPTAEEFEQVRKCFELHDLAVEDAIRAHQRPKLEFYDDTLFMVLKTARYIEEDEEVEFGEIQVFVGQHFVAHVRHGAPSALAGVRHDLEGRPERLGWGPGAVLHAIVDHVVDGYEPVIAGLENDIDEVEREVFSPSGGRNPVERIYWLMRTVLEVGQDLGPLLAPLEALATRDFAVVHPELREYFRDVHDHLTRLLTRVHTFKDLLANVLAANLTRVNIRQNEDMRKISAWVAIAAVPTMIAGIYGMNFDHMPELGTRVGYPIVLAVIALICWRLYRRFKRVGWL
jgi:magnesium transporter